MNPHTHNLDSTEGVARLVADIGVLGRTADVLDEVAAERQGQDAKWGEQNHPDGTGHMDAILKARVYRQECQDLAADGEVSWCAIALEEFYEALAEDDPAKLRAELIQVAAVAVAWVEAIDRRTQGGAR